MAHTIRLRTLFLLLLTVLSMSIWGQNTQDTWNLADLYPSESAWQQHAEKLNNEVTNFSSCSVALEANKFRNAEQLAECLNALSDLSKQIIKLYVYTSLGFDADQANDEWANKRALALNLYNKLSIASSAVDPVILKTGEKKILKFVSRSSALTHFDFYIKEVFRRTKFTKDASGEEILAFMSEPYDTFETAYENLMNVDINWPLLGVSDCSTPVDCRITLNSQGYVRARSDSDRHTRKTAFELFYSKLSDFRRSLGTILAGRIRADVSLAKARGYDSAVHARFDADDLSTKVYDALLTSINDSLPSLHRYFELRRYMLNLSNMSYYDIYPSLVPSISRKFSIDEGKQLTLLVMQKFGPDIAEKIQFGFDNRWMDTYNRPGKRSGAYMQGSAYDIHPYVLMNYDESYDSVSTLAHEWGHVLHSLLANQHQPFEKANYPTFLAEIASIVPETLLIDHMIANAQSSKEKLYYITQAMEQIRGTFYRQAMFGEFEKATHAIAWKNEPLTSEVLSSTYLDIVRKYHGHDLGIVDVPEYIGMEWAYIPHFYYNFYVFQYATSMAASIYLTEQIKETGQEGIDKFLTILRAGGSNTPLNILDDAGVNMREKAIYDSVAKRMDWLIIQAQQTLGELNSDF